MIKKISLLGLLLFSFSIIAENLDKAEELISVDLFPVDFQKGVYHINKNFPAVILMKFNKSAAIDKLKRPRIVIDLPVGFSCLGVCPKFSNLTVSGIKQWEMEKMDISSIERDGQNYTRHTAYLSYSLVEMLTPQALTWGIEERIYIKTVSDIAVNEKRSAFIKLATDNWEGKENKFELIAMPELSFNGPKTNKFGMTISYLYSMTVPSKEISEAYTNYWKSLSEKPYTMIIYEWNSISPDMRKSVKDKFQLLFPLFSSNGGTPLVPRGDPKKWAANVKVDSNRPPVDYMVAAPGKIVNNPSTIKLCPRYLALENEFWNSYIAPETKKYLVDIPSPVGIVYDFEPGAMGYCFCDNCLKDFKDFSKLEKIPSVEEIQKKYPSEWFNFRVKQNAAIIKAFNNCVKKNFPGTLAITCTDNLHASGETLANWCGVDPRLSDTGTDLFMNMPYYAGIRFYNDIELNVKSLKAPQFPLNDPAERLISFFSGYTPEKIKQNIVATVALGCKGFGFWPDDVLDGRYLLEIKSAYSIVAKAEDYYFAKRNDGAVTIKPEIFFEKNIIDDGRNITLKFPDYSETLKWTVHENKDNYLITIINYDEKSDIIANLSMPGLKSSDYKVRDVETCGMFYKDKSTVLGGDDIKKGFTVEIPKNGLKVIEVTKDDISKTVDKNQAICQNDIKSKIANIKKNFPDDYNLKEIKGTNSEISWGVVIDQKVPLVKMTSGNYKMYINAVKGAEVISWSDKKSLNDVLLFKDRGFLDNLILSDDIKGKGEYRFVLEKASMENDCPTVLFKYAVPREGANPEEGPLENLEVEKLISMQNQGKTIKIKYVFTNKSKSKKYMLLGFRIKAFPKTNIRSEKGESLSKMSKISFETSEGIKTIESGNPDTDNVILKTDTKMPGFLNLKPMPFKWTGSPVKIEVQTGRLNEYLEFTPDKENSSGVYVWWSESVYTIELLSKEKLLKYDESFSYEYSVSR